MFQFENKVALISGGASGIGLEFVKELLNHNLKGIAIADINEEEGEKVVKNFGLNKIIFVKTDVSNYESFEEAFKKSIEHFGNLDIVINNAGIARGNDWHKEIAINFTGVANGSILAIDKYLPAHRSGEEALVINMSSISAMCPLPSAPIYSATKAAVANLSQGLGHELHYAQTKVRVIALCPGFTPTPLLKTAVEQIQGPRYLEIGNQMLPNFSTQSVDIMGPTLIKLIKHAQSGSVWIVENGEMFEYFTASREQFAKNAIK